MMEQAPSNLGANEKPVLKQRVTEETADETFNAGLLQNRTNLLKHALLLTKNPNDAEDIVQETFLKAIANKHQFETGTSLPAWLHGIVRNTFFQQYRKDKNIGKWVKNSQAVEEEEIERSPAIDSPESKSLVEEILEELEKLSPEHRKVIEVVGIYGYRYEEAALILGISEGMVKSRLHRARKILRERLEIDEADV